MILCEERNASRIPLISFVYVKRLSQYLLFFFQMRVFFFSLSVLLLDQQRVTFSQRELLYVLKLVGISSLNGQVWICFGYEARLFLFFTLCSNLCLGSNSSIEPQRREHATDIREMLQIIRFCSKDHRDAILNLFPEFSPIAKEANEIFVTFVNPLTSLLRTCYDALKKEGVAAYAKVLLVCVD